MQEDLVTLGPVRLRDVERAQAAIVLARAGWPRSRRSSSASSWTMRWSEGGTMRAMRGLVLVAAVSAALKLGSLAFAWNATAVAAQPAASPANAACGGDGRSFRELLETVRAKADELQRRESALRARGERARGHRRIVGAEVTRLEGIAKALGVTGGAGEGMSIGKVYEAMTPEEAARSSIDWTTSRCGPSWAGCASARSRRSWPP
jgi:hypothetical protein